VGNDDYTDVSTGLTHKVQGADTAAPIWAEFMNRAIQLPQYSDMKAMPMADGVQEIKVDKESWLPADDSCPEDYYLAFLDGTVPGNTCSRMGSSPGSVIEGLGTSVAPNATAAPGSAEQQPETAGPNAPKKKNFLQKIFGGGDKAEPATAPQ
jgi:penicillin-binding protein 1B